MNLKFRRQHPFGNYVLDFYCHEIKLCVEADGGIHNEKDIIEYDIERTKVLNENGISVLRFTNEAIINSIGKVIIEIIEFVKGEIRWVVKKTNSYLMGVKFKQLEVPQKRKIQKYLKKQVNLFKFSPN